MHGYKELAISNLIIHSRKAQTFTDEILHKTKAFYNLSGDLLSVQ